MSLRRYPSDTCRRLRSWASTTAMCLAAALALAGLTAGPVAAGDATTTPDAVMLQTVGPRAVSFPAVADSIVSHVARRTVTVSCVSASAWPAVAQGGSADEDGYVSSTWDEGSGQLLSLSTTAELSPAVCDPLTQFAADGQKPTTCPGAPSGRTLARVSSGRKARPPGASRRLSSTSIAGPCYLGGTTEAHTMPTSYWTAYERYGWAMLILAHEAFHLSGIVGGTLPDGLAVGDPQAEAKANCFGLQWVPYVAEELGDTPADAQSIADYLWAFVYPALRTSDTPQYWSADCRPGGPLDIRPSPADPWP